MSLLFVWSKSKISLLSVQTWNYSECGKVSIVTAGLSLLSSHSIFTTLSDLYPDGTSAEKYKSSISSLIYSQGKTAFFQIPIDIQIERGKTFKEDLS